MNFTHYNNLLNPLNNNSLTMASNTNMLAQEIYDQFLACKICFETYTQPKTLSCLHSFCQSCLQSHADSEMDRHQSRYMLYHRYITCPICRKKTDIPTGGISRLPDNFLVTHLTDIISRTKNINQVPNCGICISNSQCLETKAVSKCLDCNKFLCQHCRDMHITTKVTKNHNFIDVEGEKAIECKVHTDEVVRFYCEPCEMCICILCTFQEHKNHDVSSFSDGLSKYKHSLDGLVSACHKKTEIIKKRLGVVQKCDSLIKNAESTIRDTAIASIAAIRKKEKLLISNLHESFGEASFSYIKNKDFMQEALDNFSNTCNLIDMVMKERGIELLLLKKELQEKLNSLLDYELDEPPLEIDRTVEFVAAQVNFGYLKVDNFTSTNNLDNDPNKNKMLEIDEMTQTYEDMDECSSTSSESSDELDVSDADVQTDDIVIIDKKPVLVDCSTMTESEISTAQTIPEEIKKSCTEEISSDFGTNTPRYEYCERSTLTIQPTVYAKNCDTKDLFTMVDDFTETNKVRYADSHTMCYISTNNKTIQTPVPLLSDRCTMTQRVSTRDMETVTEAEKGVSKGVMTIYNGKNKAVNTRTIVTMSTACGDDFENDTGSDLYDDYVTPPEDLSPSVSEHDCDPLSNYSVISKVEDLMHYNKFANNMVNEIFLDTINELSNSVIEEAVLDIGDVINYIKDRNKSTNDVCMQVNPIYDNKEVEAIPLTSEKCVGSPKVFGTNVETNTEMMNTKDMEMNTDSASVQMLNKSVLTDSIKTVHKGTSMHDLASAYLNKCSNSNSKVDSRRPSVSDSRRSSITDSRRPSINGNQTSYKSASPPKPILVDRASSPVVTRKLDKSISVSQSDLVAPVDVFQRAGMSKCANEEEPQYIPKLPLIREESKESPSDEEFKFQIKTFHNGFLRTPTSPIATVDKAVATEYSACIGTNSPQLFVDEPDDINNYFESSDQYNLNSLPGSSTTNNFVSTLSISAQSSKENQDKKQEDFGSPVQKNKARMQKLDITHLLSKTSTPSSPTSKIRRKSSQNDCMTNIHEQSEVNIPNSSDKSKNIKKFSVHTNPGDGIKSKVSLGDMKGRLHKTNLFSYTPPAFATRSPVPFRKLTSENNESSSETNSKSPAFGNPLFIDEENIELTD